MHNFQRDLMFLLHDVARLLRVDADKRARAHGMTRAQWGILIWLERQPGLSQKELAEILEVEPITVARLIDRLEAAAWWNGGPIRRTAASGACISARRPTRVLREIDRQRAADARPGDRWRGRGDARNDDGSAAHDEDDPDPRSASDRAAIRRSKPKRGRSPNVAGRHRRRRTARHRSPGPQPPHQPRPAAPDADAGRHPSSSPSPPAPTG